MERMKQEMGVVKTCDLQCVCVCETVAAGLRRPVVQQGVNLRHKHKVHRDQYGGR